MLTGINIAKSQVDLETPVNAFVDCTLLVSEAPKRTLSDRKNTLHSLFKLYRLVYDSHYALDKGNLRLMLMLFAYKAAFPLPMVKPVMKVTK